MTKKKKVEQLQQDKSSLFINPEYTPNEAEKLWNLLYSSLQQAKAGLEAVYLSGWQIAMLIHPSRCILTNSLCL